MPAVAAARRVRRGLSLEEQVGQLLLVGVPATGTTRRALRPLRQAHVGGIILTGRSQLGVEGTARVVDAAESQVLGRREADVRLLVATDQEGGAVQVLRGPGFDDIVSARQQGRWSTRRVMTRAETWGRQLRAAGVNLDLAPVADIVPASPDPRTNGPIGHFDRQFGATAHAVRTHAAAFACGMTAVGVATSVKHFPGLGHVQENTDTSADVTDRTVGPRDPGLRVFTRIARRCRSTVMVSTAVYSRIDPTRPAAFSGTVVRRLLRDRLGFAGVVISDDLGHARQVQRWTPGDRARMFVSAGGDLVLSVEPSDAPVMAAALLAAAHSSSLARARIHASALRVLTLKARLSLLGARPGPTPR
jgi:beta-N-acetylhexosaminidase